MKGIIAIVVVLAMLGSSGCADPYADYHYQIVVIPKGLTHEFWQSIHRGAQRAADDLGEEGLRVRIIWDGPLREQDALEQIRIVDRRVCLGVDGIVLAPQHSRTMTAPVERARAEGVPVLIIDSGLADESLIVKYVATDNYHGGEMAAKHLLDVLKAEGITEPKLILLRYAVGSESTEQREQGFLDFAEQYAAEQNMRIEWLSTNQYAGATRDSASRQAAPLISQFGQQVDGIFAPNESSASGVLDVLRSQGLNLAAEGNGHKVHLMGFDSSQPLLGAVQEGDVDGLILQDPYQMGYLGVWCLIQHLEGRDVRQSQHLSTGEHLITGDNVNDISTLELFRPEYQQRRTIEPPAFD